MVIGEDLSENPGDSEEFYEITASEGEPFTMSDEEDAEPRSRKRLHLLAM